MNVASRHTIATWKNPYITDGLIAMWDGEWNAGFGKHDPNATTWKDLIGNRDAEIEPSQVFDDYAYEDGTKRKKLCDIFFSKKFTMQFVESGIIKRANYYMVIGALNDYCSIGWPTTNTSSVSWKLNGGSRPAVDFTGGTLTTVYNETKAYMVANTKKGGEVAATTFSGYGSVLYWAAPWGLNRGSKKLHCARIYDRELTPTEIAHNYTIDKARFNLA